MTESRTLHVVKWPLGAASMVRLGAAAVKDVDVAAQVHDRAGIGVSAWLETLDVAVRGSFVVNLSQLLVALDQEDAAPVGATLWPPSSTAERRSEVLKLLNLPSALENEVVQRNPLISETQGSPLVWVDPDAAPNHSDEYLARTQGTRWRRYRDHLEHRMGWHPQDVVHLQEQLDTLVVALPDPKAEVRSPRRILVVGHTQSGKTANFLGLSARMADAGVEMIVILSGRTKLLRRQTQARVDRDLIGADPGNIGLLTEEYGVGNSFLERLAAVNPEASGEGWARLTRRLYKSKGNVDDDAFQRPTTGLGSLDPMRPILVVLKKTPGDLDAFVKTLAAAPVGQRRRPTLVIDEEADEASLHYKQKKAPGGGWAPIMSDAERTAINKSIVQILRKLELSSYVGYTATPFANCFADAGDPEGFFPHAVQVLDPPPGYFGAAHVFDSLYAGPVGAPLPSAVHTRQIKNPTELQALDDALDDYLIAAGVRLFRQDHAAKLENRGAERRLRHHTMMVHVNTRKQDQESVREEVHKRLFAASTRGISVLGPEDTATRLKDRYLSEFLRISQELLPIPGRLPTPELDATWMPTWDTVKPFIQTAVDRLIALDHGVPGVVLLVNSEEDSQTPDYDSDSTPEGLWCVLVGGLMLSRGFTIEGLSTAYFRRKAGAMDTQLQLARWNGYRNYFEDLIRLHFGIAEPGSKKSGPRNLLEEFETSSWRDFEFREQLRRYGEEGTSPRRELPRLIDSKRGGQLPATSPGKSKGLVTASGAPMEFGRRGTGLARDHVAMAAFAGAVGGLGPVGPTVVCPKCDDTADGRVLQLLTKEVAAHAVADLVDELLMRTPAGSDLGVSSEDEKLLRQSLKLHPWRLALIGTSVTGGRTVTFRDAAVPVRLRRYKSVYDTLSTGDWNDWMRATSGGACRFCAKQPDGPSASTIVLVPYVDSDDAPASDAIWGVLVQTVGRAGQTYKVVRPSTVVAP